MENPMYSTPVYIYQQIQKVMMVDTSGSYFNRRWESVYAKQLKLNLGVDNVILFQFINQDQKPVNITGRDLTFRLIGEDGQNLLIAKTLDVLSANLGRAKVTLTAAETASFKAQPASYSIESDNGSLKEAVLVDAYSSARGDVEIEDSVLPQFVASQLLTIPDQAPDSSIYYSSTVETDGIDATTFAVQTTGFTGELRIQGATDTSNEWYDVSFENLGTQQTVDQIEFVSNTGLLGINVGGYHPYLRLELQVSEGNVSQVRYRI